MQEKGTCYVLRHVHAKESRETSGLVAIRFRKYVWFLKLLQCPQRVSSPTVRIIAFQAIDPGSTPGKRKSATSFNGRLDQVLQATSHTPMSILH